MRLSLTLRVAVLAALLAIASNLVIIVFVNYRMINNAASALQEQVIDEATVLANIYAVGGEPAIRRAIAGAVRDPRFLASVIDGHGRHVAGNVEVDEPTASWTEGYRTGDVRRRGGSPVSAGVQLHRLPDGGWMINGRSFDDQLIFQHIFQRSLLLAAAIAVLVGLFSGGIIARYLGRRVGRIVAVTKRNTGGDFSHRIPLTGVNDAFERLGLEINSMLDRITSLMQELRTLTDSLAHDLRSPVQRLRARVDAALHSEDEERRETLLAGVMQEADALTRILSTVLEIGRSEAMTSRNQFAWIDPAELISELCEMYEPLVEDAGAELKLDIERGLPQLFGHRQLLAQTLSNLVDNALKYADGGAEITLFAHQQDAELRLGVADSGPGIAPEDRAEARRRFGRLDSSRPTGGAGLGLALAEAVAHLHDGRLDLEDNVPGLRAALVLPHAPENNEHRFV